MLRKSFFLLTGLLLVSGLCLPSVATAKQMIAAIIVSDLPRFNQSYDAMVQVLRSGGFDEGKLKIFTQRPNADKMSLVNSLRRCAAANVDLIITFGSRATDAAKDELRDIPLLFADVYDPVALGVVKNLAAPGAEATGTTSKTDLSTLVSCVQKIRPMQKVGVLYTKGEAGSEQQLRELMDIASKSGFDVVAENVRNPKEAVGLAQELVESCDALYLTESLSVAQQGTAILELVGTKCMVFSQIPGLAAAGALAGLEADPDEQGKLLAIQVLQVLQGQKAYILPVRPAKKINLVVNRKSAAALGLTIPNELGTTVTLLD